MSRCQRCGRCCTLIVEIEQADIQRESRLEKVAQPLKNISGRPDGEHCGYLLACGTAQPCPFLGDDLADFRTGRKHCGIYPTRPSICRNFRPGGPHCRRLHYLAAPGSAPRDYRYSRS